MRRKLIPFIVLSLVLMGAAAGTAVALSMGSPEPAPSPLEDDSVSTIVNFQGLLRDSKGNPIDGVAPVTFRIYDAPMGGDNLWEETQQVAV